MRAVLHPALLAASLLSFAAGAIAEEAAPEPSRAQAPDETDDTEGAESDAPTSVEAMPLPAGGDDASDDVNPPLIEDVAVAASSPATAPMVTAIITDDWSGIERAHVYYRQLGASAFEEVALQPSSGGMFIARLPDGTQTVGFEYYVEAWDAANNGPARLGTPEEPYRIEPAGEGTVARLEREQATREMGPVHPAWLMLSLGGGVLAAAASGIFWLDLASSQERLARETDPATRTQLENAVVSDVVVGSVLGAVAAVGLATGVGLLVYAALEE